MVGLRPRGPADHCDSAGDGWRRSKGSPTGDCSSDSPRLLVCKFRRPMGPLSLALLARRLPDKGARPVAEFDWVHLGALPVGLSVILVIGTGWISQRLLIRGIPSRVAPREFSAARASALGGAAMAIMPWIPGISTKIALTTIGVAVPSAIYVIGQTVVGDVRSPARRPARNRHRTSAPPGCAPSRHGQHHRDGDDTAYRIQHRIHGLRHSHACRRPHRDGADPPRTRTGRWRAQATGSCSGGRMKYCERSLQSPLENLYALDFIAGSACHKRCVASQFGGQRKAALPPRVARVHAVGLIAAEGSAIATSSFVAGRSSTAPGRPVLPATWRWTADGSRRSAAKPGRRTALSMPTLVTPGWVDVHTHYDGQATWDPILVVERRHDDPVRQLRRRLRPDSSSIAPR